MYLRFTTLLLVLGISLSPVSPSDQPTLGVERTDEGIAAQEPAGPPKSIGLTERARSDVALIQVMVDGPEEMIRTLAKDDFSVIVDGRPIMLIAADSQCRIGTGEIRRTARDRRRFALRPPISSTSTSTTSRSSGVRTRSTSRRRWSRSS